MIAKRGCSRPASILRRACVRLQLLPRPRISLRFAGSGQLSRATEDANAHGGPLAPRQPPHAETAARKRRRRRQFGEGHSSQPVGYRRSRLASIDSAVGAAAAEWPRDGKARQPLPAREPLSPADSASELLDPPSRWYKAGAAPRMFSRPLRTHSPRWSSGGRAQTGPGPDTCQQQDSNGAAAADGEIGQHAGAMAPSAAASRRRRPRVPNSAFSSRATAAEVLRSHPLSGLDRDDPAAAAADAQQAAQTSAAQAAQFLQTSQQGSSAVPQPAPGPASAARNASLRPINIGDVDSSQPQLSRQTESAVKALVHDGPGSCPPSIAAILSEDHLLDFGALIGETAAAAALSARGSSRALQGSSCLFGAVDVAACPWELIVQVCRCSPGVSFVGERLSIGRASFAAPYGAQTCECNSILVPSRRSDGLQLSQTTCGFTEAYIGRSMLCAKLSSARGCRLLWCRCASHRLSC
jgi:hypothetical protein